MFSFCLFRKILLDILDLRLIFRNRLSNSSILVLSHFFSCNIKMKDEIWSVWNQNQLNHLQSFLQWICGFDLLILKCKNTFEEIFRNRLFLASIYGSIVKLVGYETNVFCGNCQIAPRNGIHKNVLPRIITTEKYYLFT